MRNISVASAVLDERTRQNEKWGEQNHPNGTGQESRPLSFLRAYLTGRGVESTRVPARTLSYLARDDTNRAVREGRGKWKQILLEEVFEAFAEDDPAKLHTELVKVAAVAQQWVEAIDRSHAEEVKP
ncbi:hypothetical protein QN357_01540 [Cryobacterium sp. RTC2.1]|uniref:hypothetical protein n=1 Tax=Cryobacterium sp. RTC2.1 TaxID=3048634 RepID=UPI002B23D81D|nr:hypothetical protein [Cryobacterium sp. RTC2.1]MEB0001619.1 hypothetical protein [Cryobacterium sp. RTC2.1]